MTENKDIYKSLEVNCEDFNRIPINRRELGMTGVATSYTLSIGGALADYKMDKYLDTQNTSKGVRVLSTVKITTNFGILNFLYKKAEGKDNQRAMKELTTETIMGYTLTETGRRLGITLGARILVGAAAGAAAGSAAPIVGTIIGAVAGALIAGVVNDIIFAEENKALAEAKAENERIAKLQSQYQDKINQIASYLTNNHYIELRELTELEAEMLCKNLSNLDMDSKSGIDLMLSFPNYLKKESKQEVYSPTSPQGISFPYSSIIYLTTIKALKDTLKEYLPKAKKIVLYTPNPFVSLYTSSPFYIFNSNLSFFNPHLQYLLTSKDTQQWLYDTLFNLARDNREIIVYEWGGSIEYNGNAYA